MLLTLREAQDAGYAPRTLHPRPDDWYTLFFDTNACAVVYSPRMLSPTSVIPHS